MNVYMHVYMFMYMYKYVMYMDRSLPSQSLAVVDGTRGLPGMLPVLAFSYSVVGLARIR